jgi:hypothetical protein
MTEPYIMMTGPDGKPRRYPVEAAGEAPRQRSSFYVNGDMLRGLPTSPFKLRLAEGGLMAC